MSNIFAKSGRKNSVFYIGKILLDDEFRDTGLTNAEFKSNKVLADAVDKGVVLVGLPDDDVKDTDTDTANDDSKDANDTGGTNEDSQDDTDYGLPTDLDELKEIADNYGIEYGATIKEKGLSKKIQDYIDAENE